MRRLCLKILNLENPGLKTFRGKKATNGVFKGILRNEEKLKF